MPGSGKSPLVVVGDALLDRDLTGTADRLAPDAPVPVVTEHTRRARPGGAALAACLAARDGRDVTLVTGVGDDPASEELRRLLDGRVKVIGLPLTGALPEKTRVLAQDRPVVRLDRGDGRVRGATEEAREAVRSAPAVLVSDYGRGAADALRDVLAERPPVVWDPHPRGGPPVPGTRLVTPARSEAHAFAATAQGRHTTGAPDNGGPPVPGTLPVTPARSEAHAFAATGGDHNTGKAPGSDLRVAAREAATLVRHWRVACVAVTMGARGALLSYGEHPLLVPAPAAHHGDPCGAGDRFAATAAGLLADGILVGEAVEGAVAAASEFVAAGGAGGVADDDSPPTVEKSAETSADPDTAPDPHAVIARVRAAGGTVVAAGGCFDLLHAGHVGLLQAARRIGDCLVVCLNSDASVRRRKGAGRPVNPLADRIRVLRALACVDAVAVFDEDTPEQLLAELRPDVWVKGGDYTGADLPEAALLQEWGGQAVLLPYLAGRSSTTLLDRAAEGAR
ncbi:D-glycero-beta-D-manno-heptose 1-phosphate adenylyltransferase [Streptomyces canus]|uniref:D-glycero-beta-D-manno-heptose 1-phosphate adenylyltransferase n=1 Tax=Streptomyces canus TaxID=58343 RepID=UPI003711203F